MAVGSPQRVGSFQFHLDGQRWEWSDEVAAMHGYAPGEATPTTELLLAHKHPQDRDRVTATLARTLRDGEPFSSRHRILDTTGAVHHVLVVGDQLRDTGGQVVGTAGFYIDLTESLAADVRASVQDALAEASRSRAAIEQAKGILVLGYGITPERAFAALQWCSQQSNTKLRDLATRLVAAAATLPVPEDLRRHLDHLLLHTP